MALTVPHTLDVLAAVGRFLERCRPEPEIRSQVDYRADIRGATLFLSTVRPKWNKPSETTVAEFAKLRWNKSQQTWKLYWMRASGKWEAYPSGAGYDDLDEALATVLRDQYGCFFG